MTATLSILALLAIWLLLAALERFPWPMQRDSAMYDETYWQTVQRDTAAYLSLHSGVSETVRRNVEAMGHAAQQKLGGMTR